jgi:hypothetical protein
MSICSGTKRDDFKAVHGSSISNSIVGELFTCTKASGVGRSENGISSIFSVRIFALRDEKSLAHGWLRASSALNRSSESYVIRQLRNGTMNSLKCQKCMSGKTTSHSRFLCNRISAVLPGNGAFFDTNIYRIDPILNISTFSL